MGAGGRRIPGAPWGGLVLINDVALLGVWLAVMDDSMARIGITEADTEVRVRTGT